MQASLSKDEAAWLKALRSLGLLDTPPEQDFDDFTLLAAAICGVPVSLVSLIDEDRQWFKSKIGMDLDETPRDVAFCAHTIAQEGLFVVPDAAEDPRFRDNPLVTGEMGIHFYAGAPELHFLEAQRQAEGREVWLETNKVPLHDAQGRVIGILGTFQDIT